MSYDNALVAAAINDYPTEKYNRLFPATLTQLSPLHKVMVNLVQLDPTENAGDVYKQKSGGVSLTKVACLKLMTAANVIMEDSKPIMPKACQRCVEIAKQTRLAPQCGGCDTKNDVAYQVSILVPEPSGGHRRYIATKEISRVEFVAKNGGEGKAPVEHMAAQCETKALLRALRAGLGLKGAYPPAELRKPFAVALVVLNTTDPELKAALIQRYASGVDTLFGTPTLPQIGRPDSQALNVGVTEMAVGEELVVEGEDPEIGENPSDEMPPWMDAQQINVCQGCDQIINPKGNWSVEAIIKYSEDNFGKRLCPVCQAEEKKNRGGSRR